jgi:hypothetical protein
MVTHKRFKDYKSILIIWILCYVFSGLFVNHNSYINIQTFPRVNYYFLRLKSKSIIRFSFLFTKVSMSNKSLTLAYIINSYSLSLGLIQHDIIKN